MKTKTITFKVDKQTSKVKVVVKDKQFIEKIYNLPEWWNWQSRWS